MTKANIIFLIKITLSIIILTLLLDRALYYGLTHLRDQVYSGQAVGKYNYFNKIKNKKDILFLGSSRANRHFVANEIDSNSFNMGINGTRLAYSATLFLTLPKEKEQLIIYQIDPEYAVDKNYKGEDIKTLSIFYEENEIIRENFNNLNIINPFQNVLYSTSYNGNFLGIIFNSMKKTNEFESLNGYEPLFPNAKQKENFKKEINKEKKNSTDCKESFEINEIYKDYLKKIKDFASVNSKNVIFITSPRFHDFCSKDNLALSDYMKTLDLTYIDDTNYFNKNNNLSFWKDTGHMADEGAQNYVDRVKFIIDSLN